MHNDANTLYSEEEIAGKQIYTYIICTKFPTPSRLTVPENLKLSETEKVAGRMLSMDNFTDEQISQATRVSLEKLGI